MKRMWTMAIGCALALALAGCGGGSDNGDTGFHQDGKDAGGDPGEQAYQNLGAACTCEGTECSQAEVPKPPNGIIHGCKDVPANLPGGVLACMRSYNGDLGPKTYFANGYCSLFATKCTGEEFICGSATFGDFAAFTACPAGAVMIGDTQNLSILGYTATLENKNCAKGCAADADCRAGETDPVFNNEASQYACLDKGGVKFCFDPRDLTNAYTAEQF